MILKPNIRQTTILQEKVQEVLNDESYSEAEKESMREFHEQMRRSN